jgi:hypothetical protein
VPLHVQRPRRVQSKDEGERAWLDGGPAAPFAGLRGGAGALGGTIGHASSNGGIVLHICPTAGSAGCGTPPAARGSLFTPQLVPGAVTRTWSAGVAGGTAPAGLLAKVMEVLQAPGDAADADTADHLMGKVGASL